MTKNRKTFVVWSTIIVITVLVVLYGSVDPEHSRVFPKCPFKLLTGLDCPGWGSQRAIHHLLNLEFNSAIRANALLVFSIPYILLLVVVKLVKSKKPFWTRLNRTLYSSIAIWTVFAIVIFWWIARNMFLILTI